MKGSHGSSQSTSRGTPKQARVVLFENEDGEHSEKRFHKESDLARFGKASKRSQGSQRAGQSWAKTKS